MGLLGSFAKNGAWNFARGLFNIWRGFIWVISCRYCKIYRTYREDRWNKTVHVLNIWARHKLDLVLQPSGPDNFMYVHDSFQDPEYLLQKNVTLYYVNKNEAVFVESDPDVEVWSGNYAPFLRIAQFRHAKKLLIVPLHVFHKLAEKIGDPKGVIVFLSNTSRCGSTLLTQVFEETGECVAFSEPDALNALTMLRGKLSATELDRVVLNSVRVLCKPIEGKTMSAYVLKTTAPTMIQVPHLTKIFPDCKHLFMYRDGLKVSKSLDRAGRGMPLLDALFTVGKISPTMTQKMVQQMGLPPDHFAEKVSSRIQFCCVVWAAAMRQYLDFRNDGVEMVGVRYEDLVKDKVFAATKVFEFCGLPGEWAAQAVEKAMSSDSQRGTPLSQDNLGRYQAEEFTDEIKKQTDIICGKFKVVPLPEPWIAEGTITSKDGESKMENGNNNAKQ